MTRALTSLIVIAWLGLSASPAVAGEMSPWQLWQARRRNIGGDVARLLLSRMNLDDATLREKVVGCEAGGLRVAVRPDAIAVTCRTTYLSRTRSFPEIALTSDVFILPQNEVPRDQFTFAGWEGRTQLMSRRFMSRAVSGPPMDRDAQLQVMADSIATPEALNYAAALVAEGVRGADQRHRARALMGVIDNDLKR